MITRRQFCKVVGAGGLVNCLPSFAMAKIPDTVKVIGIGGAGRGVIELLRQRLTENTGISLRTINWSPNPHNIYDYDFSQRFRGDTLSAITQGVIHADLAGYRNVVLVAGISGRRVANLTHEYARLSKREGVTLSSVLISPYPVCWGQVSAASEAASRIANISDRVIYVDAKTASAPIRPVGMSINRLFKAVAESVVSEIVGMENA